MSVQKYILSKESSNFTIIPNNVLKGLSHDLSLLGLYCYLLSLPPSWEFHKSEMMKTCDVGVKKLESLLRKLQLHRLIHIEQRRDESGKFCHFDMTVLNGELFVNQEHIDLSPPCVKNRPTVNGSTVKRSYKRKNLIKERKIKERESTLSDFVPSEKHAILCQELGLSFDEELASFKSRHPKNQTPYEFERWLRGSRKYRDDKAAQLKNRETISKNVPRPNEIRSTVPFHEPSNHVKPASQEVVSENMNKIRQLLGRTLINGHGNNTRANT